MARLLLVWMMGGAWLGLATNTRACSCIDAGAFLTVAEKAAWKPGVLMVRAEVRDQEAHGMEVKILAVLNGSEEKSVIRVWGDPGFMCRTYTTGFKKGEKLVLILRRIENATYLDEQNGDYELSGCGTFVVREAQNISGRITASDKEMSKTKFFGELDKIIGKNRPDQARIFPNPVEDLLTISVPDLPDSTLSARIITLAGQPLQTRQLEVGRQHQIDVSTLATGIYIILFRTEHQFYTRRLIKK
ncbi:T9SS type A sorting domain-containing protein [Larkinella knui]|nr:T9SS type A sorting domain-containing protein [Larkinella knui]